MIRCPILWAALGIAFSLGCRKSDEPALASAPPARTAPADADAEPPPTEAEAVPEIRALIEKAAREGGHMRFWRLGAGTPGPDGWVSATPTDAGPSGVFTVIAELPEAAWATHRAEVDRFIHSLKTKLAPPGGR